MSKRTGSIDVTITGRHRVRIPDGGIRKTLGIFDTRSEAEVGRAAAMIVLGSETDPGVRLGKWVETYLTKREISGLVRDPGTDWNYFKNHITDDAIARVPVKSLRPIDADELLERLRKRLAKRGSILKVVQLLRGAMKLAIRKGYAKQNPFAEMSVPKEKRTEEPWTYAELEEQDALAFAARAYCLDPENERLARIPVDALIDFAMGSGLRAGEIITLRIADAHVDAADPHVIVRYGTAPNIATKTGKIREVPLFGRGLSGLKRWLASMPSWVTTNPHKLVFVGTRGGFRSENHVIRWDDWTAIRKLAGLTRTFRWHDLRHTCASSLVSGVWGRTWTLLEVRDMLGHQSITTTERYAHLAATALKKAASEAAKHWPSESDTEAGMVNEINGAPERIRISDLRFRKSPQNVGSGSTCEGLGLLTGPAEALFAAVLAKNEVEVARLSSDLARGVLALPHVRLAFDVLAGGPHVVAKAIDLADLALAERKRVEEADASEVG